MPERLSKVGLGTPSARHPKRCSVEHEWISSNLHPIPQYEGKKRIEDWSHKRTCAMCSARAQRAEERETVRDGGKNQKERLADPTTGVRVSQTWWCCNKYKVNLCSEECFEEWDHERSCAPCVTITVGAPASGDGEGE